MANLPEIAALWIGGELSFLEQLCLKSYVDNGHETTLYVYENVEGIPPGVKVKDATEVYRGAPYRKHFRTGSAAIHADYFRVKLMKRGRGEIWVDTDAYCYKPFNFTQDHIYGYLHKQIANGVMRLPPDSEALRLYDEFLESDEPMPPFGSKKFRRAVEAARKNRVIIPIEAMPWGVTGPMALSYFLKQTGEIKYALPEPVFYPMSWHSRRDFLLPTLSFMPTIKPETVSIHFFGRVIRRITGKKLGGLPKPGTILEELCVKHGIDPKDAPIKWTRPPLAKIDAAKK